MSPVDVMAKVKRIKVTRTGKLRYKGRRVRLAGAHTWDTVIDFSGQTTGLGQLAMPEPSENVLPSTRLWAHIEVPRVTLDGSQPWATGARHKVGPLPWRRKDGKWDLSRISKRWLNRVESVVSEADSKDIITGVVMFDGAFNRFFGGDEWEVHPMNPKNNIQGVGPSTVQGVHAKGNHNKFQKLLIKELAQRLDPYGNVILEIANEPDRSSVSSGWYGRMISVAKRWSKSLVAASYVTRLSSGWMKNQGKEADIYFPPPGDSAGIEPKGYDTDHGDPLRFTPGGLTSAWGNRDNQALWLMDGMNGSILRNVGNPSADRNFLNNLGA